MDDHILDPFGDDSDLLDRNDSSGNTDSGYHFLDPDKISSDIKTLPKLVPFTMLSHSMFDHSLQNRSIQEEQVAIIYALSQLMGKDVFDRILEASRHYKRFTAWTNVVKIYEEILSEETLNSLSQGEDENSMMRAILTAHLETTYDIAKGLRDMHELALAEQYPEFDPSLIHGALSFNDWDAESDRFLTSMKAVVKILIDTVNKAFSTGADVNIKVV